MNAPTAPRDSRLSGHEYARARGPAPAHAIIGAKMPANRTPPKLFETRSQAWREVGLLRQINPRVVKRARLEALLLVPLFVVVVVIYDHRVQLFGTRVAARPGHPAHHHLEQ